VQLSHQMSFCCYTPRRQLHLSVVQRLGDPQSRSRRFGTENKGLAPFTNLLSRTVVTVLTELQQEFLISFYSFYRLHFNYLMSSLCHKCSVQTALAGAYVLPECVVFMFRISSTTRLLLVMQTKSVYCEVGTGD